MAHLGLGFRVQELVFGALGPWTLKPNIGVHGPLGLGSLKRILLGDAWSAGFGFVFPN